MPGGGSETSRENQVATEHTICLFQLKKGSYSRTDGRRATAGWFIFDNSWTEAGSKGIDTDTRLLADRLKQ